jgi:hypothetical protein
MVVESASSASSITSSSAIGVGASVHQQLLGVRGLVVHRDAHVGQHRDHALDLLGVGHVVGQVVVDLGVREVAALLAQDDQVLQALLLRLDLGELHLRLVVVVVVSVCSGFLHEWGSRLRQAGKTVNCIKVSTFPRGQDSHPSRWRGWCGRPGIRPVPGRSPGPTQPNA